METRTPRWAPETDPQWGPLTLSPRHPSGKKTLEPVEPLHSDFAAVGTNYWFVWPEENWPPDWAWFLPRFSPFCHRWSFRSLPLSPLACLVGDTSFPAISPTWLHRYYLNWTELDDAITKFNNEMPLTEKCLILSFYISDILFSYFDIVQLLWHNLYC